MNWFAQAPANIALIKYMGKADNDNNQPINASLSYTLPNLLSFVELESIPNHVHYWEPLDLPGGQPYQLSKAGQQRFLTHLERLKEYFDGYTGHFIVRSCNTFPQGTGLASSASSFAALTLCAARALSELTGKAFPDVQTLAELSRLGSGSSCRSFFKPWCVWSAQGVGAIDLPYVNLIHQVVLISHTEKTVSSSEAHRRVLTSPEFAHRAKRVPIRMQALINALQQKNWQTAFTLCWQEFTEMHALFETSNPSFSYITDATRKVLDDIRHFWQRHGDGPLVTLDAGPNIHLLYREDQADMAHELRSNVLLGKYDVI